MTVTVGDVVRAIDELIPFAWAEPWDQVGLLAGDPLCAVSGVMVTLDQTREAVARAAAAGANVIVSHHPAFKDPPGRVVAGPGPAGVIHDALAAGVALVAAHTNLDRDPRGADALPVVLGLEILGPLESGTGQSASVVVFAPPSAEAALRGAFAAAGAGRIGAYAGCTFTAAGVGRWTALDGASPSVAGDGDPTDEVRIEAVCDAGAVPRVVEALRAAHPYEEPLITVTSVAVSRGAARMGRICRTPADSTVLSLARLAGERLAVSPRAWGAPDSPVRTVAIATGSAASMVPHAIAAGADALVCGELRYHDALEAVSSGLAVIEAGHDATEWPLVGVLADAVKRTPGLDPRCVIVERPGTGWYVVTQEG